VTADHAAGIIASRADDVVDAFIKVAADAGIDRFRIHDPLNDVRNVRRAMEAARAVGRQVEAARTRRSSSRGRRRGSCSCPW